MDPCQLRVQGVILVLTMTTEHETYTRAKILKIDIEALEQIVEYIPWLDRSSK